MKPLQQVLFAAGLLILGGITWLIITRPKPQAEWLQVEAPTRIAPGATVTLRVTPVGLKSGLFLNLDLHGTADRHRPLRVVGPGRAQRITGGQPLEFRVTVSTRPDLAEVHAIIYASPTGGWSDRVRAAKSEAIPVIQSTSASDRELRPLRAHEHTVDPEIARVELPGLRWLLVMLWLIVAGVLVARSRNSAAQARPGRSPALIATSLAIAVSEIFHFEPFASELARQFARKYGFYDGRLLPQQIAIVFTVVVVASLVAFILFKARNRRLVLGLLGHIALTTTAILSLHDADALLYTTLGGTPVEQLAKMATVSLALWGLRPLVTSRVAGSA